MSFRALQRVTLALREGDFPSDRARLAAIERREVREAVPYVLAVAGGIVTGDLLAFGSEGAAFVAFSAVSLVVIAVLAAAWWLGHRRHSHELVLIAAVVMGLTGALAAAQSVALTWTTVGMGATVIVGGAVLVPWSWRWHASYLTIMALIAIAGWESAHFLPGQRPAAALVLGAAFVTSSVGNQLWIARRRIRARTERELRNERRALAESVRRLGLARARVEQLQGILPVCSGCGRIGDGNEWQSLESYVVHRSGASFTHGICPTCARRLYPDYLE